ncbi:MAG: hypothetical protein ACOCYO_06675 [Bacteroidota bacterium]
MKKITKIIGAMFIAVILFSSCTSTNKTMKEPNVRVDLTKSDFTLSEQVTAEASSTQILTIDWARLFKKETGTIKKDSELIDMANLPVVGNIIHDKTANYALYELMTTNTGYDVIFYPQYETTVKKPVLGIGFIMKETTVKTTARLGKLNE